MTLRPIGLNGGAVAVGFAETAVGRGWNEDGIRDVRAGWNHAEVFEGFASEIGEPDEEFEFFESALFGGLAFGLEFGEALSLRAIIRGGEFRTRRCWRRRL